jgi:hypothetical protein
MLAEISDKELALFQGVAIGSAIGAYDALLLTRFIIKTCQTSRLIKTPTIILLLQINIPQLRF